MFRYLAITPALLIAGAASAQTTEDPQVWNTITVSTKIVPHIEASGEVVTRFGDAAGGLYELELGGWIGYKFDNGVQFDIGYVRVPGYDHGHNTRIEDRPRQQVTGPLGRIGAGKLDFRVRLEERFRNSGSDMGMRLRTRIRYTLPLGEGSKTALVASHESFFELNDTDWGQAAGYRRMRNAIGIKTPLLPKVTLSVGYLNQLNFGINGKPNQMAHVLDTGLSFKF